MKNTIFFVSILLIFAFAVFDCNNSNNPVSINQESTNLISNSSFESAGKPSLAGWFASSSDTAYVNFSTDVPKGGGKYSVSLRNVWTIPGRVWTYITPSPGTHVYRLSAWAKVIKQGPLAGGDMEIFKESRGVLNTEKSYHFSDTLWTYGEMTDTLTASATDTVVILLRGNSDQFSVGLILFDMSDFEQVN